MTRATRSGSAGAAGQEPGSQGMGHRYGSRVLWKRFTAAVNLIINISTSLSLPHFLVISRYCSLHGYRPMTNWKNLKRPLSSAAENLKGPALDTRNAAVSGPGVGGRANPGERPPGCVPSRERPAVPSPRSPTLEARDVFSGTQTVRVSDAQTLAR